MLEMREELAVQAAQLVEMRQVLAVQAAQLGGLSTGSASSTEDGMNPPNNLLKENTKAYVHEEIPGEAYLEETEKEPPTSAKSEVVGACTYRTPVSQVGREEVWEDSPGMKLVEIGTQTIHCNDLASSMVSTVEKATSSVEKQASDEPSSERKLPNKKPDSLESLYPQLTGSFEKKFCQ